MQIIRIQKRVCKDFEIKHLEEYHDFYVPSDTLLSADVLEDLRNTCLVTYKLDRAKLLSAPVIIQKIIS